jgi:hypothetical protein
MSSLLVIIFFASRGSKEFRYVLITQSSQLAQRSEIMNPTTLRSIDLDTWLSVIKTLQRGDSSLFRLLVENRITIRELWSEDTRFTHYGGRAHSAVELFYKSLGHNEHGEYLERWLEDFEKRGFCLISETLEFMDRTNTSL